MGKWATYVIPTGPHAIKAYHIVGLYHTTCDLYLFDSANYLHYSSIYLNYSVNFSNDTKRTVHNMKQSTEDLNMVS